MQELIEDFISAMSASGAAPINAHEILADDKKRRYAVDGDKAGQKTGCYQLKIEDSFGYGWFINYRCGEAVSWHSKTSRKFTPEEKKAWKNRIEKEKQAKEKERQESALQAAIKANDLWKYAKRTGSSEYLKRKQISGLHGAKLMGDVLVIAAFKESKASTLQFISQDGEKRFLEDGEKQGAYFPLATRGEDLSRVVIAEGYATAASIREATGLPVVVAFDAGNLAAVAQVFRDKYPDSELIFAADNDAWGLDNKFRPKHINPKELPFDSPLWDEWREKGFMKNIGVEKAQQAAVSIGGARVVIPKFDDLTGKPTDFNDLHVLLGLEAVKQAFSAPEILPITEQNDDIPEWHDNIPPPEDIEAQAQVQLYVQTEKRREVSNWKQLLTYKANGSLDGTSNKNLQLFLEYDPVLSNLFCFDEFSCEMTVYQCPPWGVADKFRPRVLSDEDVTFLTAYIEKFGLKIGFLGVQKSLFAVVKKNAKNPAQEYFSGLKWDGVKRLDTWLRDYCGATAEPEEYISAIGRKWLCASVMRVMNPGHKFDNMLVLEGNQGIGKSTILKELATIHGHSYFDDKIRIDDLTSERTVTRMQGLLIIEIAELAGIRRHDADSLKNALSVASDRATLKYQNQTSVFPRKFVFAGTINPGSNGYLSDVTGNRRYWPVTTAKIDLKEFKKVKEQLWAEAVSVAKDEELYLSGTLEELHQGVVSLRLNEHPWTAEIARYCMGKMSLDKDAIWDLLRIDDRTKRTAQAALEIGKIMTAIGFQNKRVRVGNVDREYRWVRESFQEEIEL